MKDKKLLREFIGKVVDDDYRAALELQEMIIEEKSSERIRKAKKRSFKTLEEQDAEYAGKMKEVFKRVDEAHAKKLANVVNTLDESYAEKLQKVMDSIDAKHSAMLEDVKNHYEQKLNKKD